MKAYIYKKKKGEREFVCSQFDNSSGERVSIYHDNKNIFQQYYGQGDVDYEQISASMLPPSLPSGAVESENEVGSVVAHVWRPGLCLDIDEALNVDLGEKMRAKKELKILIEKLHDILLVIEPDDNCLHVYGHKIRELLILACTECENLWTSYIRLSGNTKPVLKTTDYIKLKDKLFLGEYQVTFSNHPYEKIFTPFKDWDKAQSTQSLKWYDGYNKTKHNKNKYFCEATLENCINAISAIIVLFCVRYGPYALIGEHDICTNLINEYFSISLENPKFESFYIPCLKSVKMATGAFYAPLASTYEKKWVIQPFTL